MPDTKEASTRVNFTTLSFLVCVLVLSLSFLIMPKQGFWINDNGCKFMQVESIIESGFKDFSIRYPGKEYDPSYEFNPLPEPFGRRTGGKLYANYSPVFAVVSAVPYMLFGFAGLYVLPLACALISLYAVWVLSGMLPGPGVKRSLSVLMTVLCTPFWFYSVTFWEHIPAICLVLWAVVGTLGYVRTGRIRHLLVSALCCAAAVYFRDDLYLMCAILCAVVALRGGRWQMAFLHVLILICALAPLWLFQWRTIGTPLGFHISSVSLWDGGFAGYIEGRRSVLGLMFGAHGTPWISIAANVPFLFMFIINPALKDKVFRKSVIVLSLIGVVQGVTLFWGHISAESPVWWLLRANGLFAVSPILLLAFLRKRQAASLDADANEGSRHLSPGFLIWLIMILHAILYFVLSPGDSGGIHWGNRYLLHFYPLMAVLAGSTVARWLDCPGNRIHSGSAVLSAIVAISIAFQVYSIRLLYQRKSFSELVNDVVQEQAEEAVIASGSFVPQELARAYGSKTMFLVPGGEEGVARLAGILGASGVRRALVVRGYRGNDTTVPGLMNDGLNFMCLRMDSVDLSAKGSD
jgi:hypothetical protein